MAKDWNGNACSIFKTLGASNHTSPLAYAASPFGGDAQIYFTDPVAIDLPLGLRRFPDGRGRSNVDRGYGVGGRTRIARMKRIYLRTLITRIERIWN